MKTPVEAHFKYFWIIILLVAQSSLANSRISMVPPVNDDCAGAIAITVGTPGLCAGISGTNVDATASEVADATIPSPGCGNYLGGDVWFLVVVDSGQIVTVKSSGDGGIANGAMAIYAGSCAPGGLTLVDCNDDESMGNLYPEIVYDNTGDTDTLYVRYWSKGNAESGTFEICAFRTPPVNDSCSNAILLQHVPNCINTLGTSENGTQSLSGCEGTADDDVWYKFVATSTTATIEVTGNGIYDAVLEFYSDCNTPVASSCTDNSADGELESYMASGLTVGNVYYYRIYDFYQADEPPDDWTFNTCVYGGASAPPNDECSGAISLTVEATGSCVGISSSNINATASELGDPTIPDPACGDYMGADVWFSVVIDSGQTVTIQGSDNGGMTDGAMALYSGSCGPGSLTLIDCDNDSGSGNHPLIIYTNTTGSGATFYIRYWAFQNAEIGTFQICVSNSPLSNDNCADAILLQHTPSCINTLGTSENATQSFAGCEGTADDDVWFKFEATNTTATIEATGNGSYDVVLEFYSDCSTAVASSCRNVGGQGQTETYLASGLVVGNIYYYRIYDFYANNQPPNDWTFNTCVYGGLIPPDNDECASASTITISADTICTSTAAGTLAGATASGEASSCPSGGNFDDDVWFKFEASDPAHVIELSNITGSTQDLDIQVSGGSCAALTELICHRDNASKTSFEVNGLTPSNTYFVRVASFAGGMHTTTFDICVKDTISDINPCSTIVTSASASGPGSLREAIECSQPGDTIRFDAAVFNQTIALDAPTIAVSHLLYIEAQTSDNITLSNADMNNTDILISIQDDLSISGLKIIGLTDQSMILKIESGGGLVLLNTEVEKATIDN